MSATHIENSDTGEQIMSATIYLPDTKENRREVPMIDGNFKGKPIISARQFSRSDLEDIIFPQTDRMRREVKRNGHVNDIQGKLIFLLFYQSSTRTAGSFVAAALRLGGMQNLFYDVKTFSGEAKGEQLPDTTRAQACFADALVLRHTDKGASVYAQEWLKEHPIDYMTTQVINAGDGPGEHPTQAILDTSIARRKLGKLDGKTIVYCGDNKFSRTVHSGALMMSLFDDIRMIFIAPEELQIDNELRDELRERGVKVEFHDRPIEVAPQADWWYHTRPQTNLHEDAGLDFSHIDWSPYVITPEFLTQTKPPGEVFIHHPFPRGDEIPYAVDKDPRAAYFEAMHEGMLTRMAELSLMFGNG